MIGLASQRSMTHSHSQLSTESVMLTSIAILNIGLLNTLFDVAILFREFHEVLQIDELPKVILQGVEVQGETNPTTDSCFTCSDQQATRYCIDCIHKLCDQHVLVLPLYI